MEFVAGTDLADELARRGHLSAVETAAIGEAVASQEPHFVLLDTLRDVVM